MRPGAFPEEHLGDGIGALQQPDQRPFQNRQQRGGAIADGGDRPDDFLECVPGALHRHMHLRHQPTVGAGLLGSDNPLVVAPNGMPGRLGIDDAAAALHDAKRDLTGGPDDGRPVRDRHTEGGADGGGGGWLGVVGPQVTAAPGNELVKHADGGLPHLGAQRVGRIAGEQVPDRLAELAVGRAVHAKQVAWRVVTRNLGAGQRGLAPVGHPPRRGAFYAQQIFVPVDDAHGLAASRGCDLGVIFREHSGEAAAWLGSEGEGGDGGPVGRGAGDGHGHSFGAAQLFAARTEHQRLPQHRTGRSGCWDNTPAIQFQLSRIAVTLTYVLHPRSRAI